jgi:hypothetical protein
MKSIVLTALLLLLVPTVASAQGRFDGTWRIDPADISFPDKPDELLLKDGKFSCSNCVPAINVTADGSDQKVGAPYFDTLAVKVIDPNTVEFTYKKDGKVVQEMKTTVSPDGTELLDTFTYYPPQGQPVKGQGRRARVAKGPEGAHALSGSWRIKKLEQMSESGLTWTYKSTPDGMTMQSKTGESYDAKFDGKEYPIKGDRAGSTVSLRRVDDNTLEETTRRNGKVVSVAKSTLAVDGKTLNVVIEDKEQGTTTRAVARKQ